MAAHPHLVSGEGETCTELMRAMGGRVAIKGGAEAVYVAIVPEKGMGIALKVVDGGYRAAEAAVTALLAKVGAGPGASGGGSSAWPACSATGVAWRPGSTAWPTAFRVDLGEAGKLSR